MVAKGMRPVAVALFLVAAACVYMPWETYGCRTDADCMGLFGSCDVAAGRCREGGAPSSSDGGTCAGQGAGAGDATVSVPRGEFWRGCKDAVDGGCGANEKPGGNVFLDDFSVDKFEVTVGRYRACVEGGCCTPPGTTEGCNGRGGGMNDHPVNCVTWGQAQAYCAWVGMQLPTEAQWEKAARGTDGRTYPWGSGDPGCERAVARYGCGQDGTLPVSSRGVSPYGTGDMAGNVAEWVADWYGVGYYASSPYANPAGPDGGINRVVKGGGWKSARPEGLRSLARFERSPTAWQDDLGFRCARPGR
jgi:formylglycine-generating enzyme required for sulfatase activity